MDSKSQLLCLIYFGSLLAIFNPFFTLAPPLKFAVFAALQTAPLFVFIKSHGLQSIQLSIWQYVFVVLFFIAILRVKNVEVIGGGYESLRFVLASLLSIYTFFVSCYVGVRFPSVVIRRSTIIVLTPIAIILANNFSQLTDWSQRDQLRVGDFTFDSYQTLSFILGLTALNLLGEIDRQWKRYIKNIILIVSALFLSYFVFNGYARGEAVAFVVAVGVLFSTRITLIGILIISVAPTVLLLDIDNVLMDRFATVYDGDYGMRDELLWSALRMLQEEPLTIVFGGGVNAFQAYFSETAGFHPHNILMESWITGGLFMCIAVSWIYVRPVTIGIYRACFQKNINSDYYNLAVAVFILIVNLKSGTIVYMWVLAHFTSNFLKLDDDRLGKHNL